MRLRFTLGKQKKMFRMRYFENCFAKVNSKGQTLLEVLIALGIVVATFLVISQNFSQSIKISRNSFARNECRSVLNSSMNKLASLGNFQKMPLPNALKNSGEFVQPILNGAPIKYYDSGATTERGIASENRWKDISRFRLARNSGGNVLIRTPHLYLGTMNALMTLKNRDATFCTNTGNGWKPVHTGTTGTNPYKALFDLSEIPSELKYFELHANMRLFNINTGDYLPCNTLPANSIVAPRKNDAMLAYNVDWDSNVFDNIGFEINLRGRYKDEFGSNYECHKSNKFSYGFDGAVNLGVNNEDFSPGSTPTEGAGLTCGGPPLNQHDVTLQILFENTSKAENSSFESGLVAMCRDRSFQVQTPVNAYPADPVVPCRNGTGYDYPESLKAAPNSYPYNYNPAPSSSNPWQACERVNICGAPIDNFSMAKSGAGIQLTLTKNNIPDGCIAHVEAVLIDPVGNIFLTAQGGPDRTEKEYARHRHCGTLCEDPGSGPSQWTAIANSYWPNGYFYCGGCP